MFQGIVPSLCAPTKMVGRHPGRVVCRRALSVEELVTLIQPIQWIDGAIVRWEFQLVELGLRIIAEWRLAALDVGVLNGSGPPWPP